MPTQKFALAKGGEKRLEVSWRGFWKEFTVRFDGQVVGSLPDQKALKAGGEFPLPDGSTLTARLKTGLQPELELRRNGQPLEGSASDPQVRLGIARGIVYFVGGLNVVIGLVAELAEVEVLRELGIGWLSAALGVVFLALAYFVGRRSRVALGIAVALFVLDAVMSLWAAIDLGGRPPTTAIVIRIFLLLPMLQGFGAMKAMDEADRRQKSVEVF